MTSATKRWSYRLSAAQGRGWLAALAVGWLALGAPDWAGAQDETAQRLLKALAAELGVAVEALAIVKQGELALPHLEQRFLTAKVQNRETDSIHEVTLDAAGQRVNKEDLFRRDLEIKIARYGKLEPELYDRLQALAPDDVVEVAVWLAAPDDPLGRPSVADLDAKGPDAIAEEMEANAEQKQTRLAAIQRPLLDELLAAGAEVRAVSELAPVISARLMRRQVEALAQRVEVEAIYLIRDNALMLDVAGPAMQAPGAWSAGVTGFGEKIAIIEDDGIVFSNPYLKGMNRLNRCFGQVLPNGGYLSHATAVAGVVASRHSTHRGMAFDATLLGGEACSLGDSDLETATAWARNHGARVHINAWGNGAFNSGRPTYMSRIHETVVRDWAVTVVDSAGNCHNYNCQVIAPAIAYNVIAVGAYDDHDTAAWSDDAMWFEIVYDDGFLKMGVDKSSFIDPVSGHGDREKPELAAPGVNVASTLSFQHGVSGFDPWINPWGGGSGTSLSAPAVAGGAALLMQRNGLLRYWPEAVKAILMVTAVHNIEGNPRLSEKDGAGGVALAEAERIVRNGAWRVRGLTPGDFSAGGNLSFSFTAAAGSRVRAVIAWDASPAYWLYALEPGVDLDLYVNAPSGLTVARSSSFDNTYEIVDFVAPETGTYRLRVHRYRWWTVLGAEPSTFLGVAWAEFP